MRYACGIFVGAVMTSLLVAAVVAYTLAGSLWTALALGAMVAMNGIICSGFGRALYDVFFYKVVTNDWAAKGKDRS